MLAKLLPSKAESIKKKLHDFFVPLVGNASYGHAWEIANSRSKSGMKNPIATAYINPNAVLYAYQESNSYLRVLFFNRNFS